MSRDATRRAFLTRGAAGALALAGGARPARAGAQSPASIAGPAARDLRGVTVTDVTALVVNRGSVFVRVRTSAGVTGWGECSPYSVRVTAAMVNEALRPLAVGAPVFQSEPLWDRLLFEPYKMGPGGVLAAGISGIDLALWDIKGKLLGLPVSLLLGGQFRDRVRAYFSIARGEEQPRSALEMARRAGEAVARGFTAVKIRMQFRQMRLDPTPDPSPEYAREVRAAIGDRTELLWDVNNGYTTQRAIDMGRRLHQEFGIVHYEEPVSPHNYAALAQVADAVDVPVAAGEHEYTRWQFRDLITQGRVDIVNPDVVKCCGLTEARRIAAIAQAHDLPVVVHNTQPSIGTAATLHYIASLPNGTLPQEWTGPRPNLDRLFTSQLRFADGHLEVPQAPGLGLDVDERALATHEPL